MNVCNGVIKWLEEHKGKKPRTVIFKEGKTLKIEEMTKEEKYERNLGTLFYKSIEKKILDKYEERPIEEVPEEYREKIEKLRKHGLGITTYEEIIKWLEEHKGKMPRGQIIKEGRILKSQEMTEEERNERKLYVRFSRSIEKKMLDEYEGKAIEEVPEEYREKIENLRKYGLGITAYEQILKWLEGHGGKMPRSQIFKEGKLIIREKLTDEEQYEVKLYSRFKNSTEKKILKEYEGKSLEEVPEEYREEVENLRKYGLGLEEKDTYEEIIKWLEEHKGKMPRSVIRRVDKILCRKEMTEEEQYEVNLYARYNASIDKKVLEENKGKPIEEVSEEYREKVENLRKYGLGITTYEEIIKWIEEHNGKNPRGSITKNGKFLNKEKLTEEEKYERNLYQRYRKSIEKKILDEYEGRPIGEVPEEYREKIATLRKFGQLRKQKDVKIENVMKKTVAKQVGNNHETRKKLDDLEYQRNKKNINEDSEEIEI